MYKTAMIIDVFTSFSAKNFMVSHSFQNYNSVYAGFSPTYACLHMLHMGFEPIYMTI